MVDTEKITSLIFEAVDEINEQLPKSKRIAKDRNEALFGEGGKLDSLGLVNFIVEVEGLIDENFDTSITLADEKAMSMKNSPFRTLGSLADYIANLLENEID